MLATKITQKNTKNPGEKFEQNKPRSNSWTAGGNSRTQAQSIKRNQYSFLMLNK